MRNIWITEVRQKLEFYDHDKKLFAKWSEIEKFVLLRKQTICKNVPLTFDIVCLTPFKKQKVETCFCMFCDKTISVLKLHPEF